MSQLREVRPALPHNHRARVQYPPRVQRRLDRAHGGQLRAIAVFLQIIGFHPADAVFEALTEDDILRKRFQDFLSEPSMFNFVASVQGFYENGGGKSYVYLQGTQNLEGSIRGDAGTKTGLHAFDDCEDMAIMAAPCFFAIGNIWSIRSRSADTELIRQRPSALPRATSRASGSLASIDSGQSTCERIAVTASDGAALELRTKR